MEFELIVKKIMGTLSDEESVLFDEWYNESQEHRNYFNKVKKNYLHPPAWIDKESSWIKIEKRLGLTLQSTIKPKNKNRQSRMNPWKYGIAASMLILVSLVFIMSDQGIKIRPGNLSQTEAVKESTVKFGSHKAILTLEDNSELTLGKGRILEHLNLSSNGEELVYQSGLKGVVDAGHQIKYNMLTIPRGGSSPCN